MLHKGLVIWTIVSLILCGSVVSNISAQTIGLNMGSQLISDRVIFKDNTLNPMPRPFTYIGLNYQTKGVTMHLNYTFDYKIITIGSSIQLWNINKRKHKTFALLNNRQ